MPVGFRKLRTVPTKLATHIKLFRQDTEKFGRNIMQFTNPALLEKRMIDVMHAQPMHVRFDEQLDNPIRLNVLDSAWSRSGMTGGPNTVINLASHISSTGIMVRLVSTVEAKTIDPDFLRDHIATLRGQRDLPDIEIASAAELENPLELGVRDIFLATHWTTAHQLKAVLPLLPIQQFFYMLQEFEPGFYPWSSNYARSIETMEMDFHPVINEKVLAEFLLMQPIGRLATTETRERAIVFEPAVDRTLFHPQPSQQGRRRRLLFYARPSNTRNMFGLGLLALREVASDPTFRDWEFVAIGDRGSIPILPLGNGHMLRPAPWVDYGGYAQLLQQADLLLCPMLSPHTSYPVLEMVACGGISITNTFMTKTSRVFEDLSPNIISVPPTTDGFVAGLREGAQRVELGISHRGGLNIAVSWNDTLTPAAARIVEIMTDLTGSVG